MALLDFQAALGRLIRASDGDDPFRSLSLGEAERACLDSLVQGAGYGFTVGVQRSWCLRRTTRAGYLTLSVLPSDIRRALLEKWISSGGGTSSFVAAESEALLGFIANHLPDPSHEVSLCRLEQATLRAGEGAMDFAVPDPALLTRPACRLRRGRHAGLVIFQGDPDRIVTALLEQKMPPPISSKMQTALLFGPGFKELFSPASPCSLALWERLSEPMEAAALFDEGFLVDDISALLRAGVVESSGR